MSHRHYIKEQANYAVARYTPDQLMSGDVDFIYVGAIFDPRKSTMRHRILSQKGSGADWTKTKLPDDSRLKELELQLR